MLDAAADLDALERFVLDAEDLTALESLVGRFNVFHALGVARAEIRHSNALAWLLDPAELDGADLNRTLVHRERKHIDLTIHSPDPPFVIAIENKIDAKEHSGQLGRYAATLDTDFAGVPALRVFLTPDGDEPAEDGWVAYSYADLHAALTRTRRLHAASIGGDVGVFIDHYLSLIGSELMDDPKIDELCQRIYKNHKRAIDLIVERADVGGGEVVNAVRDLIEEDSDRWHIYNVTGRRVDFVPRAWLEWIPPIGVTRDEPRSWIRLFFTLERNACRIIFEIGTATDSELREKVVSMLADDDTWKKFSRTKRGTGRFNRLWNRKIMKFDEGDEVEADEVIEKTRTVLAAFERDSTGVEQALRDVFSPTTGGER